MTNGNEETPVDEMIGKLISSAGPGATASPDAKRRIYEATLARWKAETGQSRSEADRRIPGQPRSRQYSARRRYRTFGIAATIALSAVTLYWLQVRQLPVASDAGLAQFAHIEGSTMLLRAGQSSSLTSAASAGAIETGDTLRTGDDGRLALDLAGDLVLRANIATEITFIGPDEIDLLAGTIYIDTHGNENRPLLIATALGKIEHLGTQYEVHVDDAALRVRIREGSVAYSNTASSAATGEAGEQLVVDSEGEIRRSAIAADASDWQWAENLATLPPADNYEIVATLEWIARERGQQLEYEDAAVERRLRASQGIVGLEGLNPTEALEVIARTTGIRSELRGSRLVILN